MNLRVYVASLIPTYPTPRYDRFLEVAAEHYQNCEVIPAREHWYDTTGWLEGWPCLLRSLHALVAFGEPDGIVGRGTFVEIVDAVEAGREVWIAEQPRRWWPPTLVDAPRCPGGSLRRTRSSCSRRPTRPGEGNDIRSLGTLSVTRGKCLSDDATQHPCRDDR
jgi:hypothetical protein